jgi:hypothetical protein
MRGRFSERFRRSQESVPPAIQRTVHRKLEFLLQDLRHPALRAKKYDEARALWQARVTRGWRCYFAIEGDTYRLHTLGGCLTVHVVAGRPDGAARGTGGAMGAP